MSASSEKDMTQIAKLRGYSSSQQQLMDNIQNKAISWIVNNSNENNNSHLCHPNSIQWSNQNIICCVHGPYLTLIDLKLLYHSRPLDSVIHECRNDLLNGVKGALSHIKCGNAFVSVRFCPFPPSLFTQNGLLLTLESNYTAQIYGMPPFTVNHSSNTSVTPHWTVLANFKKYLQNLRPMCVTWLCRSRTKNNSNTQYCMIGTKEGQCLLFELLFKYESNDAFDLQMRILNKFKVSAVITQIESVEFENNNFIALAFENGLCEIWKNKRNTFETFECIKQCEIDLLNNGSIACLKWNKSDNYLCLAVCKQRLAYIIQIKPRQKQYSSQHWLNKLSNPNRYFPQTSIIGCEFLQICDETILITTALDGSMHAWNGSDLFPISKDLNKNKNKKNNNIFDKLIIDIYDRFKNNHSLGIAKGPNHLLLCVIHSQKKKNKFKKSLHVYPLSIDYEIIKNKILSNATRNKRKRNILLFPTNIALSLDYFTPFHIPIMEEFIAFNHKTFGKWFEINDYSKDLSVSMAEILSFEPLLRYCLSMIRYFVSRIQPFQGMNHNSYLTVFNALIPQIFQVLLQLHVYKILNRFIEMSEIKTEKSDSKHKYKHLSIYLFFQWLCFAYLTDANNQSLTVIFSHLLNELFLKLERVFQIINDQNCYEKCRNVRQCLYGKNGNESESENSESENSDNENGSFTMNFDKIESCPICDKLMSVVMNNGPCGSDGDKDRHLIARCCSSFTVISDYKQLFCCCCNGSTKIEFTKQLIANVNDNIMVQSFHHCKPFVCAICDVPLVQVL